ncbi:MAG: GTP-binding protein [Patescibacteria group bacterium]
MVNIRNFCIIAHVDHGKSTLADRLLEITETIKTTGHAQQLLDSHPISRERGITIKLAPVTMNYRGYCLNLIDTPGHVDFSYEVERSLAACEGAILLVDAAQGIQAQTLSHFQKAKKLGLKIIPVVNKIDAPSARVEETIDELAQLVQLDKFSVLKISAKTGEGVQELLGAVIERVPSPKSNINAPTRALIFSSVFDPQRGTITYVRIVDGEIDKTDKLFFLATHLQGATLQLGHFTPKMMPSEKLSAGEVGYIITNIKDPSLVKIGDTITTNSFSANSLIGYKEPKPMVYVSLFPVDQNDYSLLEDSLRKLRLNDSAITFSATASKALGRGFRCGFLGHLHAEVSQERLEQDYRLNIIATMPTVEYRNNEEPWVKAMILAPSQYLGAIIGLCENRRGILKDQIYHGEHVTMTYELPLSEIITDFFDQLKSNTAGYGSIDYEILEYRPFEAVNLEILINHEAVDAFSQIMEKGRGLQYGKFLVERLKEILPRQQIPVAVQASIAGQIIARADVPAFRKDVIAKLYGGDRSRKDKLLEAQKKGKKKMKRIGKVEIPGDTFLRIFKT